MPYKDPAVRRAYMQAYDAKREGTPKRQEQKLKAHERDKARDDYRERRREIMVRWLSVPENHAKALARSRQHYQDNREARLAWSKAKNDAKRAARAEIIALQDGLCYLCGLDLDIKDSVIDHWHGCCPKGKDKYCPSCIRGAAHHKCNTLIGLAGDDPVRLRRIADALERATP